MFYCEQNYFQSNLNPKEIFFLSSVSLSVFTLTENVCFMLPLIPILLLEYFFIISAWHLAECTRAVFVKAAQTRTVQRGSKWVNSLSFVFLFHLSFFLILSCLYVLTERCGMCNTAYCKSMQAKNCGTLFSVYGICKCTGRNYLYFSNVISLIWGKTVLQLPESH